MPSGAVKFFDLDRGYGFISPDDGREDIFVHASAVNAAGLTALGEGDVLEFDVENVGGRYVATELALVRKGEVAPPRRPTAGGGRPQAAPSEATQKAQGVVKWFNPAKGFGFIQPDDGGADVFVHVSAVERAGLAPLSEGQAIRFRVARDRRTGKISASDLSLA